MTAIAGAKLRTPFLPLCLDLTMPLSDSALTSLPRHGGFFILHPADSRVLLHNVRQLLEQRETLQLWCQQKVTILTHCLRLLVDLEYNFNTNHSDIEPRPLHTNGHIWARKKINDIARLRSGIQDLLNTLRRYRFDHHRQDHFHHVPPRLYRRCLSQLSDSRMNCQEALHELEAHQQDTDGGPIPELPFDYQMWQRGLSPQFDPDSDSD